MLVKANQDSKLRYQNDFQVLGPSVFCHVLNQTLRCIALCLGDILT